MIHWEDTSSRTLAFKDEELGQTFEARVGSFETKPGSLFPIVVTRNINLPPTDWRITMFGTTFTLRGNKTAEQAKEHAVTRLTIALRSALAQLETP